MTRTYLKSAGQNSKSQPNFPTTNNKTSFKQKEKNKEKKPNGKENRLFEDSDDFFDENLRLNESCDDTFDNLFKKSKVRAPLIVNEDLSSEKESTLLSSGNDSGNGFGLFRSFSEKDLEAPTITKNIKKKINPVPIVEHYPTAAINIEPEPASEEIKDEESDLLLISETTQAESSIQANAGMKAHIGSPASFFNKTPGVGLRTKSKTVSCLTSTPVLSLSRYSVVSASSVSTHSIPEQDDDVFLQNEQPHQPIATNSDSNLLRASSGKIEPLSSNEIYAATPESFINPTRGKKQYGGPVLSIMNHYQFRPTLLSPAYKSMNKSKVIWSPASNCSTKLSKNRSSSSIKSDGSSSSVPFDASTSKLPSSSQDVTENTDTNISLTSSNDQSVQIIEEESEKVERYVLGCLCGDNGFEDWLVMCDGCLLYYHATCVGLTEDDVKCLAQDDPPEWFCKACNLKFSADDSVTSKSFMSSLHECGSDDSKNELPAVHDKTTDMANISLMFNDDLQPEFKAKPGKQWRKSIAVSIMKRNDSIMNHSNRTCKIEEESDKFDDFAVPSLPVASSKPRAEKRITRRSSRLSQLNTPTLAQHDHKQITPIPELDELSINPDRSARPSFYMVHAGDSLNLDMTADRSVRCGRPSFYMVPKNADLTSSFAEASPPAEKSDLDALLSHCTNTTVVQFEDVYQPNVISNSKKVGEGAFGEVFLIGNEKTDKPVLKIVPIGGDLKVNDEDQTLIADMMSEVVISQSLSKLRQGKKNRTEGFVEVRNCVVFQGKYPEKLLELWDQFDAEKTSENTRPDFLPTDQLYIALEFNNGGQDLEKFEFRNASQALAAWKQVVHTLAVAESHLHFEHRDLHWGNILIKETQQKTVDFVLNGFPYRVETGGVITTIIDFSLSRLTTLEDEVTIFKNLAEDPTLFLACGVDKGGDYQFDVYRMMKKENSDKWEEFNPKSNILWLHYVLDKMIKEVYYKKGKKKTNIHRSGLSQLRKLQSTLLEYNSAHHWVSREGCIILNEG